jgi:hypothetical protein
VTDSCLDCVNGRGRPERSAIGDNGGCSDAVDAGEFLRSSKRRCVLPKRKRISNAGGKKGRRGGDRVSPTETQLSEFRVEFAELPFRWATEPGPDHKHRLEALKKAFPNVRPAVEMLLQRAPDQVLARADVVLCLAEMAGHLLGLVADLTQPEAAKTPAKPARTLHISNKSSRARAR